MIYGTLLAVIPSALNEDVHLAEPEQRYHQPLQHTLFNSNHQDHLNPPTGHTEA